MADFNVPESPVFEEKIRQLETTDPAHASVFNNILVKLFHNIVFNRKKQQEHEFNKQNPHKVTPTQIGAATVDALDMAYQNGNAYTDAKIADLINGAPNTMDTLKEISDAMAANKTVVDALEDSIGSKAPKAELDTHVANKTLHITAAERTKWNTVDTSLSGTSTNPIQNKVVKAAFDLQNAKNSSLDGSIAELNSNLAKINSLETLYTNANGFTGRTNITLLKNIESYDYVCIHCGRYGTTDKVNYELIPVKLIKLIGYGTYCYTKDCSVNGDEGSYIGTRFINGNTISAYAIQYARIYGILGIK